ncbi:MAG: FixH family protein [Lysobacterales bacterium]
MPQSQPTGREPETSQIHPWYRYPWPWVAIGIPAIAVIGGLFTLYLAITHPDPLVVDDEQYRDLRSGLVADPGAKPLAEPPAELPAKPDGDR